MRSAFCLGVSLLLAAPAAAQDMPLSQILLPGEGWELVSKGWKEPGPLTADRAGNVYVADREARKIWRVDGSGRRAVFAPTSAPVSGMCFGPDGLLYACHQEGSSILTYSAKGKEKRLTDDPRLQKTQDLVVTSKGMIYCTSSQFPAVYLITPEGKVRPTGKALVFNWAGITLWPDEGTLVVNHEGEIHAFRVEKDGSLTAREAYYAVRGPGDEGSIPRLTMDRSYRLYAATTEGVQVFDPTGRLCGVLLRPERAPVTALAFGGPDFDRLYVLCNNKLYVRKLKVKGVRPPVAKKK
jgi:gluconolactonase